MAPVVTLHGIDEAISNLDYRNEKGTKFRLVQAIRAQYGHTDSILSVKSIDSDKLIGMLWEGALDSTTIRNRRRNLSSIKSSVNADLKKLYGDGKNPEGITISSVNTFVMSDEAKDSALEALSGVSALEGGTRLDHLADAINTLKQALSSSENLGELSKDEAPAALNELRDLIRSLSEKIGIVGTKPSGGFERGSESPGAFVSIEGEMPGSSGEKVAGSFMGELEEGDAESIEPEPADEILEAADEEDEGVIEEEIEEVEDADVEEPLDGPEFDEAEEFEEAELDEEDPGIDLADELEEIDEAEAIETEDADVLEEADPEETVEEVDEEELEDVELSDEVEDPDGEAFEEEGIDPADAEEEFEAEDVIESSPEELLEDVVDELEEALASDIETVEEEPEDVEATGAVFEEEDPESIEPDPSDEILEAVDEEDEGVIEEEIEEVEDADVEEPLDGPELDEAEEFEEVEEFEAEALEEPPVEDVGFEEDVTADALMEDQEVEQGLEVLEPDDGNIGGGSGFSEDVGGNACGSGLTDDFREEGLLDEAEKSGRLLKDFGEETLNGEPGLNQNQDRLRVLAEQFNRSLAAMDRFFNQYVLIPNGKYPVGKKRPVKGERNMQIIELPSFYMGKFPVTNALFEVFVEKTGYKTTAERMGYGTVYDGRVQREVDEETGLETYTWSSSLTHKVVKGACWYQPLGPGSTLHKKRNHPVVQVSLEDALAFAAWTGKGLPGEDEWEAASRTAKGLSLPWGSRWKKDVCNLEATSIGDTTAVDRFVDWENELGIADTLGNVWEWTSSTFEDETGSHVRSYIAKGGSWTTSKPLDLTSRLRVDPESHSNILGFRCVAY